jgi:hypothetical protein
MALMDMEQMSGVLKNASTAPDRYHTGMPDATSVTSFFLDCAQRDVRTMDRFLNSGGRIEHGNTEGCRERDRPCFARADVNGGKPRACAFD